MASRPTYRASRIGIAALLALTACACSDTTFPAHGISTGAGAADAGSTGAGGSGAGTSDGGTAASGGGGAADPGWKPVAWPTPSCSAEVASNPAAAMPSLEWQPCPNGAAGCESVVVKWKPAQVSIAGPPTVLRDGDGYRVGLQMSAPEGEARHAAVFGVDGKAIAAWRSVDCLLLVPVVTPERVWFGAQHGIDPSVYLVEKYADLTTASKPLPLDYEHQRIAANGDTLALEGLDGAHVTLFDRLSASAATFGGNGQASQIAQPVADVALFLRYPAFEQPEAWLWKRSTQDVEPLVQPAGQFVVDIKSDGSTIAWLQVPPKGPSDSFWPQGDLWTSAFATSKATLVAKKRRPGPIVGEVPSAIGEGYYAVFSLFDGLLHVYRLSDAHHWTVAPVPQFYDLLSVDHVDATYVWYHCYHGIVRQRLDALGPGDPAP